jgi:hypothetical protein
MGQCVEHALASSKESLDRTEGTAKEEDRGKKIDILDIAKRQ